VVQIPLDGNFSNLPTAQMYVNNAACTVANPPTSDRIWFNGSNSSVRPIYGKTAFWGGPTINTFLVPLTVDANFISLSAAMTGVAGFLNPACGSVTTPPANSGFELKKVTNAQIGLPDTIAAPLKLPLN
jgi:hypothetical protein